jgi:sigma-B regulation protein RsbU (phosphoserine phosphatase)
MLNDLRPSFEAQRLAAVQRYAVLDSPPDGAFDRITALAARLLDAPISIVSIVDTDRIWFKSHHGLDVEEINREPGLCASAILQNAPWIVNHASVDPRTLANPLVAGEMGLQFYAGVPLTTHDGFNLGTLCVIDSQPRQISADDVATLTDLATLVMDELELRLAARTAISLEAELRRTAEVVAAALQSSLLPATIPIVNGLSIVARYHVASDDVVGGDFYDVIATDAGCTVVIGDAVGKGVKAAALTGIARWTVRTLVHAGLAPAEILSGLNSVIVNATDTPQQYVTLALADVRLEDGGADVRVALGGHPHPIIVRAEGVTENLGKTGPLVGWRNDASYSESAAHLGPGDILVMFTDGTLEAIAGRNATDNAPIRRLLVETSNRTADGIADTLDGALHSDLDDDAALLIIGVQ